MSSLTEQDIFAPFIGKTIIRKAFDELARDNGSAYVIYNSRYLGKHHYRELFGVTERLKEQWEYSGVDFNLYLTINDDVITAANLDKYREAGGGHGRPSVHVLKETQQELRVARRILQYITV